MSGDYASRAEAMRFLSAGNLHQSLWLPANDSHDRLRVTFATTQNFGDSSLPAILFCGPMFGSRWNVNLVNHVGMSEGVRFICVDRPGMGGSTRVPLDLRFKVWLETVPALLEKLEVQHVYLACHSAGTLFAMQTLYHLRNILEPKAPYVAFVSPWVHNEYSNAILMNLASKVPVGVMDSWSRLIRFFATNVMPMSTWSGGLLTSITGLFQREHEAEVTDAKTLAQMYGTSEATAIQIEKLSTTYFFAEDIAAGNEEAKLCLRKSKVDWGICEDYSNYVRAISEREAEQQACDPSRPRLKVRAFFAESDMLIGKSGRDYFENTWRENSGESIDFNHCDLFGTNHDTAILSLKDGAVREIIADVKNAHRQRF